MSQQRCEAQTDASPLQPSPNDRSRLMTRLAYVGLIVSFALATPEALQADSSVQAVRELTRIIHDP